MILAQESLGSYVGSNPAPPALLMVKKSRKGDEVIGLPFLKEFEMYRWLPADEAFQKIYTFISWMKDNPPIPNKQTDIEKVESHGFDKKTSFRNIK